MNFLPWSRFLIIVSSPACIGNRNHFRTHRDQILIGSLVNSKQVNGDHCKKETFTARLLLYVYVGYLRPHPPLPPPPKKREENSPDLHQSQELPLAKVGWTCPPQSTPWRRPCLSVAGVTAICHRDIDKLLSITVQYCDEFGSQLKLVVPAQA